MRKYPIIYEEIKELGTTDYKVVVATTDEDQLPQYAIINKHYGVVEFTHEVLPFIKNWLEHFIVNQGKDEWQLPGEATGLSKKSNN